MRSAAPQQHAVFSAGRLSRVAHLPRLAASPSCHTAAAAAAAAARSRLSTPAGVHHAAPRPSVSCAAVKAEEPHKDDLPQRQGADAPAVAPQPTTSRRTRGSKTPVRDVPWNAAAEAAVLQFWTDQGALLPEAEVQPEQHSEQRRLRSTILWRAAKHPRHRDVEFLTDYMARLCNAAADSSWTDAPWRIALSTDQYIAYNRDPAGLLHTLQATEHELVQHGICLTPGKSIMMARLGKGVGAKAASLQLLLEGLQINLDLSAVVRRAPALLALGSSESVLKRRVAALQQLHPQLHVGRVLTLHPGLLSLSEESVAARWASLQLATGLSDDDMRVAVQMRPDVLARCAGVVGWKSQQLHAYVSACKAAGAACPPIVKQSVLLCSPSYRVWRLRYLIVAANFGYTAHGWVQLTEEKFVALNPGYSVWLSSHPIPPEAYQDFYK